MAILTFLAGCGFNPGQNVNLAGTWKLTTAADTGLTETLLTFDENNRLTEISFAVGPLTATYSDLHQNTKIQGDSVIVDSTFLGNGLLLDGIINSDQTVITATITAQVQIPLVTFSINEGQAILSKQ
jgi:hypothetical protein